MKGILFLIVSVFISGAVFGQASDIAMEEAKLEKLLLDLRSAENDTEKAQKNEALKTEMARVLENRDALTYPFDKLATIGFIDSPDGQMRIVNWNIEQDDFSQKYVCFVLHVDKRKKTYHVTELTKDPMAMPMSQPQEVLASNQWYGALYYQIIPFKKGSKTVYTVLGWDYYSSMSQRRVIDAIYFTGKTVKMGSPIFKVGKESKRRMFYEHSKKASMVLRYEQDRDRIMMDHLSPESPSMKNFKSFYVPDMSYDAFERQGGKWVLREDVIGVNKGGDGTKQVVYVKNERTGKVEAKTVKTKWQNPEDLGAPAGGAEHVAVTPESAEELEEEQRKANEPEADKKDKRDPNQMTTVLGNGKKKKRKQKKNKRTGN